MKNKKVLYLPVILSMLLAACAGLGKTPTALPTVILGSNASTPAPNAPSGAEATASGVVVTDRQAHIAFKLAGNVTVVNVAVGDRVEADQPLVELDSTTQKIQLEQANLALQELTSPSALATAQHAVAQDQLDLNNFQVALTNLLTQHNNQGLVENAQAGLVLAGNALSDAQTAFDDTPGDQTRDPAKAVAYQKLYAVQRDYDHALYIYNLYSGKANQPQVDEATYKVALAKARLADDQTLVAALTGAALPDSPTGAGYASLMQAKLAVQSAQAGLDATRLVAPFAGEVAIIKVSVGDYISPGQVLLVISDVRHLHVETTDLSERDVPQVKLGQTVSVSIKPLNQVVSGKVLAISPLADSLGGDVVYKATISLDEIPAALRAGMTVDVQFMAAQ
jgi:multidrug efflux pump subunit AcrA (membrane-fusion protein)